MRVCTFLQACVHMGSFWIFKLVCIYLYRSANETKKMVICRDRICSGCFIRCFYSQNVPLRFGYESLAYRLDHLNHSCFQNKGRIFGAA